MWLNADPIRCNQCHTEDRPLLAKTTGFTEKAVGVMDKGQLQVNTSNFGDLANFHVWFTNSGHWPRTAPDDHQYLFGLGFMVGINEHNVIETTSQALTRVTDWLPPDDAAGHDYSGEIKAISDQTPFQASSDFRQTWPKGYWTDSGWLESGDYTWPGYYRIDVNNPGYPAVRVESEGEFTSDRDIYCTYNDDYNSMGRVGLSVEQTAYSYGRPYAEDFTIWDLKLHNNSGHDLDSIYVGFLVKIRPDYDNHDYVNFVDTDGDGKKDMVITYDLNNEPNRTWANSDAPLAAMGLRVFDTPGNIGITDFHHFAHLATPTTDEGLWALMTSDHASSSLPDSGYFFHGSNVHLDNTDTDSLNSYYPPTPDEESGVDIPGDRINYVVSCGPFNLIADSMTTVSIGLIAGNTGSAPYEPDFTDLMANTDIANKMYTYRFQGSGPPGPPNVGVVGGDSKATLFWSSEPSENSVDVLTRRQDFEGYKIFRSTDLGLTWGDVITDAQGYPAGYKPIAIFDKVDGITGTDPAFPQYLGSDIGLTHTFTDSNLVNGVEYWYCVTSYDQGNQVPDSLEQSYMYPLGSSDLEQHTVSVVPGLPAVNLQSPSVPNGDITVSGGVTDGSVRVEMVDPNAITGDGYRLTIEDSVIVSVLNGDTTFGTGFTLVDTTKMDTLLLHHPLTDETGDNLPVVDGFRLIVENVEGGVRSLGWTKVAGDTCTFDWRYQSIDPSAGDQLIQEDVETSDDWRITVDYTEGDSLTWIDMFSGAVQPQKQWVPIKIEIITDPENTVDVTGECWLGEFAIPAPESYRKDFYSPLGWDLEPGGLGYNAASPGWYEKHVDILILEHDKIDTTTSDTTYNYMYLFTNNKPDTSITYSGDSLFIDAKAPSDKDQFTIRTFKPFQPGMVYRFGTTLPSGPDVSTENPLKDVQVVPDPYVVTNTWETGEFGKKLQFNHLPQQCTIRIYTLAGERVATVEHNDMTGYEFWDMRTSGDQFVAPGVYLYHVKADGGWETTGRFLVIK